jgi:hypothetical protein
MDYWSVHVVSSDSVTGNFNLKMQREMKQEVKVSFYVKRNEEKEDGTCPVMARLTACGSEAVFSAKLNYPALSVQGFEKE